MNISFRAVNNTIGLLEQGATIPFISRYRKEATGSLDEVAVSHIDGAWNDLRALIKRKQFVLEKIHEQDRLTQELRKKIDDCWDAVVIEDIYLPYKTKRKTKAFVAKENGLEPLAELIWNQRLNNPEMEAKRYLGKKIRNTDDALNGARDILAERVNESPEVRNRIRALFSRTADLTSKVVAKKKEEAGKYKDYFDYSEAAKKAPAHRILAVFRAENEKMLKVKIEVNEEDALFQIERLLIRRDSSPACKAQLRLVIKDAYKRLLAPSIETEFRNFYKDKADDEAISVFAENLKQLLLAPPLGNKKVMGIDPGFRTGCKLVCLDENGQLEFNSTIYPHPPQNRTIEACAEIEQLVDKYKIEAIAIGNGTAGKETLAILKSIPFEKPIDLFLVNENGASIY
ncbi:MAG: RNA-binding transcriptional accessory protein, partial [Bacteroidia bacterium]|nr:RNA-binding transcriptional accessory protein [Bacteroidia bacterium]